MSARKIFLLVDDDHFQRSMMEMEFKREEVHARLCVVNDGAEARQYIAGEGDYHDREKYPLPAVIILDLRMPRMDGFEFLTWLRARPEWPVRRIPVVMMAGSSRPEIVSRAYELGANAYLAKDFGLDKLREQVQALANFWGVCAETWQKASRRANPGASANGSV